MKRRAWMLALGAAIAPKAQGHTVKIEISGVAESISAGPALQKQLAQGVKP